MKLIHTAVAGLAVGLVLAGCGTKDDSSPATSSSVSSSTAVAMSAAEPTSVVAGEPGPPQLTVDGKSVNVTGAVVCSTTDGKFSIAVGDLGTGYIVGLEPDGSVVHSVGLPIMDNGLVLAFTEGVPGNDATAAKEGNTYSITGTVSGTDNANAQVSKPFEIDVTCP